MEANRSFSFFSIIHIIHKATHSANQPSFRPIARRRLGFPSSSFEILYNPPDALLHFRDALLANNKHGLCIDVKIMMCYDVP